MVISRVHLLYNVSMDVVEYNCGPLLVFKIWKYIFFLLIYANSLYIYVICLSHVVQVGLELAL